MKSLLAALLTALFTAAALVGNVLAADGKVAWDKFPEGKSTDIGALQNGARLFVNYCLNCHAASYMRYNRLQDIGLSPAQIKQNLLFATDKIGDTMNVAMNARQANDWFGAQPPDLSLVARSRAGEGGSGADYLYTYLRSYYRDDTKITGGNNRAFPNVGMPHVLWELQGQRSARYVDVKDAHDPSKTVRRFDGFVQIAPGKLSPYEYDEAVGDLVAYLHWMAEPNRNQRVRIGVWVLFFLAGFTVIAWRLNAAYWKDVK